jgi:hypothetical protein
MVVRIALSAPPVASLSAMSRVVAAENPNTCMSAELTMSGSNRGRPSVMPG